MNAELAKQIIAANQLAIKNRNRRHWTTLLFLLYGIAVAIAYVFVKRVDGEDAEFVIGIGIFIPLLFSGLFAKCFVIKKHACCPKCRFDWEIHEAEAGSGKLSSHTMLDWSKCQYCGICMEEEELKKYLPANYGHRDHS